MSALLKELCASSGEFEFDRGQEIELKGLICACRHDGAAGVPLGNAIKDSMAGKLTEGTRGVVGVVYATREAVSVSEVERLVGEFEGLG